MTPAPDPVQEEVLRHERGPLLVTGPAGTGKTAVLRERFARLIEAGADPERVVLVVGSKRARDEARLHLLDRLRSSLPTLPIVTLQGLAYRVVNARYRKLGYDEPPAVLPASDQFAKVRELLEGEDPAEWPAYGSMLRLRGFADEVRQYLLRAQEALLRPDEVSTLAERAGLSGWRELARFHRRYLEVLDAENAVDFAGLVEQAASAARNHEGGPALFEHVLVDDFQDTTLAAEALLAVLAPESLVVAGDPQAHVFSFQGTTDEPLHRFADRFPGAERVELAVNHRGRPAIEAWWAPHTSEEHEAVARELRRIHVEEGVAWNDLAVVVRRHGSHVGGLLRALDDAGVPRFAPEAGPAAAEPAIAPYALALQWLGRPEERDGLVEALLTSDLARLSPAAARAVVRAARAAGLAPGQALARWDVLTPDEAAALLALRGTLERAEAVAQRSVLEAFRVLWARLECSARLVGSSDDRAERDLDALVAFARAVEEAGDRPVREFLEEIGLGREGPGAARAGARASEAVNVLTAHATAGREFDTVLLVGAVEGNFPSLSRPEPMFDLEALRRRRSRSERNRERVADERRLFDTVLTRARRRVVLLRSEAAGDGTEATRFIDVKWVPSPAAPFPDPISVQEAGAAWRRELADHTAVPAGRLAALHGLLALGADPSSWWFQRDWTDTGAPLHEQIRVSASKLDRLENCDLQFVLADDLGLEGEAGYHAWVGHTVHRIIQDCEEATIPRDLDALVAAARQRWRPEVFPSRAVSDAFLRLVTELMLPAWMRDYGVAPALATERRFEFEFEGATVTGYIDRIGEVQGGGSQITDFKTGKKPWGEKANQNLQLGVYYLAVNHAEELAPYRPVRAIELAFVRHVERWGGEMGRIAMGITPANEPAYSDDMTERIRDGIRRVRELYGSERFRPNPSANCRYCDFKQLCPLYPEGQELFPARGERS